ncbi:gas vesicle protein [Allosaccharopolyspora coralli]|uniref:Gas vesicle protein n=1 Tax=Allosaccharopolyspora coralli TaxID=2665642 RepID=A0A5Q3QIH8_9PSEU|nr:gas vesicle protein [Allosaccharopolyspora coralli]
MTEPARQVGTPQSQLARSQNSGSGANLADILERVLDKGIVIAGDIQVNLLDIELLTIKLRLLVASVDKAKEMGIDWWEHDPSLSSASMRNGQQDQQSVEADSTRVDQLQAENDELHRRLAALEGGSVPEEQASEPSQRKGSAGGSSSGRRNDR